MKTFQSIDEIFDFAIKAEQNANAFYTKLAKNAENKAMRIVFEEYAAEEKKHETQIRNIKEGKSFVVPNEKVQDLKIAEYTTDATPSDDMTYQEALILAMKREKNAYKLYTDLSKIAPNDKMVKLFTALANEEAKHKLRFEIEYDDIILQEN